MAIAILSIPPESSESERVFSGARTCSWDRSRLPCLTIQTTECIGSLPREGHIHPFSANGMVMNMGPVAEDELEEVDDDTVN